MKNFDQIEHYYNKIIIKNKNLIEKIQYQEQFNINLHKSLSSINETFLTFSQIEEVDNRKSETFEFNNFQLKEEINKISNKLIEISKKIELKSNLIINDQKKYEISKIRLNIEKKFYLTPKQRNSIRLFYQFIISCYDSINLWENNNNLKKNQILNLWNNCLDNFF